MFLASLSIVNCLFSNSTTQHLTIWRSLKKRGFWLPFTMIYFSNLQMSFHLVGYNVCGFFKTTYTRNDRKVKKYRCAVRGGPSEWKGSQPLKYDIPRCTGLISAWTKTPFRHGFEFLVLSFELIKTTLTDYESMNDIGHFKFRGFRLDTN